MAREGIIIKFMMHKIGGPETQGQARVDTAYFRVESTGIADLTRKEEMARVQEQIMATGVTPEDLSRFQRIEKEFSPESHARYEKLRTIVLEEWEAYRAELLEYQKTRRIKDPLLRGYFRHVRHNVHKKGNGVLVDVDQLKDVVKAQIQRGDDEVARYVSYAEWRASLDVEAGLTTDDAVQCVEDKRRTLHFIEQIRNVYTADDRVIEPGSGTGILSIAVASTGARVESIELNPLTTILAYRIRERVIREGMIKDGQVKITCGDALKYQPSGRFSGMVQENLYTGQFNELQIQIANHLLDYVDGPPEKKIPAGMLIGVELTSIGQEVRKRIAEKTDFVAKEFLDPKDEAQLKQMGTPRAHDYINCREKQPVGVRNRFVVTVAEAGVIDSVTIFSLVQMSSQSRDFLRRNEGKFLGNDHVIMLEGELEVEAGTEVAISISYRAGDRPDQADIQVKNLRTGKETRNIKGSQTEQPRARALVA